MNIFRVYSRAQKSGLSVGSATAFVALFAGMKAAYAYGTTFEKTIIVENKFIRVVGDENSTSSVYSLSDTDNTNYKVAFSLWWWNWYPAETWTDLKKGNKYVVKGYGWRFPYLINLFPNITSIKKVE